MIDSGGLFSCVSPLGRPLLEESDHLLGQEGLPPGLSPISPSEILEGGECRPHPLSITAPPGSGGLPGILVIPVTRVGLPDQTCRVPIVGHVPRPDLVGLRCSGCLRSGRLLRITAFLEGGQEGFEDLGVDNDVFHRKIKFGPVPASI
jgi:hypothetical protein